VIDLAGSAGRCWTRGGWGLDGFDQHAATANVVPTVIAVWGMSTGAGRNRSAPSPVVTSSVGGCLPAALADVFGPRPRRVRRSRSVVFGLHLPVGLCPELRAIVFIMRGLQGLGFGGEWATGAGCDGGGSSAKSIAAAASAVVQTGASRRTRPGGVASRPICLLPEAIALAGPLFAQSSLPACWTWIPEH